MVNWPRYLIYLKVTSDVPTFTTQQLPLSDKDQGKNQGKEDDQVWIVSLSTSLKVRGQPSLSLLPYT